MRTGIARRRELPIMKRTMGEGADHVRIPFEHAGRQDDVVRRHLELAIRPLHFQARDRAVPHHQFDRATTGLRFDPAIGTALEPPPDQPQPLHRSSLSRRVKSPIRPFNHVANQDRAAHSPFFKGIAT